MNNCNGRGEILPWHIDSWQQLCDAKQKNRLSHAILIQGPCGVGKEKFAEAFAHTMLCSQASAEGYTCGQCHACHLLQAGSHPDLVKVAAEPPSQIIKVDQIRDVVHFVNETSMQGGFRVIIIRQAHRMNHNAANSLLKTLEEPAPNTLFILLSGQGKRLQATITSRCQKLTLAKPERGVAIDWLTSQLPETAAMPAEKIAIALNIAEGAPIKALSMLTDDTMTFRQTLYLGLITLSKNQADPLQFAGQWHERDLLMLFHMLFYWLQDILKLQVAADTLDIVNVDYRDDLVKLTSVISKQKLLLYLTHVQQIYAKIINSLNLNRQLLLEDLLIRWTLLNR